MSYNAKVDILVPIYNVEQYLAECLDKLCRQTLKEIRIICVDDGSKDTSQEILTEACRRDSRIVAIIQRNGGVGVARNRTLRYATAPFIQFCDPDDFCASEMCEKMLHAITSANADIAVCGTHVLHEADPCNKTSGDGYFTLRGIGKQSVTDEIILRTNVALWNKIWRRDLIVKHDISFQPGLKYEDGYFYYIYMSYTQTITFVNEKLYTYRRRADSIMHQSYTTTSRGGIELLQVIACIHDYLKAHDLLKGREICFMFYFLELLGFAMSYQSSMEDKSEVYTQGVEFIERVFPNRLDIPFYLRQYLRGINPTQAKRRGNTFLRVKEKIGCRTICILGLPLYKVKYSTKTARHYILGISLFTTKLS